MKIICIIMPINGIKMSESLKFNENGNTNMLKPDSSILNFFRVRQGSFLA